VIHLKKTLFTLFCIPFLLLSIDSISVYADDNVKRDSEDLDLGSFNSIEEYTENENKNEGLNPESNEILYAVPVVQTPSLITTYGAGEWDYITSDVINTKDSKIVSSSGGDFRIEVIQPYIGSGFSWLYKVYEDDGKWGDDLVGTWKLYNKSTTQVIDINARNWVDGDNKKAEFYIRKMTVPTHSVNLYFYD
jgi:hypothetical protein